MKCKKCKYQWTQAQDIIYTIVIHGGKKYQFCNFCSEALSNINVSDSVGIFLSKDWKEHVKNIVLQNMIMGRIRRNDKRYKKVWNG